MKFIKDNLIGLIVLVLLLVLFAEKCSKPVVIEKPKVVRDTVWVKHDSIVYSKPQLIRSIQIESHDTIINRYIPDTNYAKLVIQYQDVVNQLLAKNILSDSIRIDTNGYVKITDTVQKNLIVGRSSEVSIKYPIIKETITLPAKKVNQLYVGGAILGNPAPMGIMGSALLKTRNDFMFGGSLSVSTYGTHYGFHLYQKIKLKKHE
jgi:hypothetical protein